MDTEKINLRITQLLAHYELSASAFADSIAVQRSSISHLLKGRNKPSLEFVTKLVHTYPEVDLYWLLYGQGEFPKQQHTDTSNQNKTNIGTRTTVPKTSEKEIEKVVFFFKDGTFSSYIPESQGD